MEEQKHICGRCGNEFVSEEDYLNHDCLALEGEKPTVPQAMGVAYEVIQAKALERGAARAENNE